MTTALATLSGGALQLTDMERAILEEAAHDEGAYDPIPTRITISPGGTNIFTTTDGEALKSFTAIVAISQKARAYWPAKGTGQPPMCSSPDGVNGYCNPDPSSTQFTEAAKARTPHPAVPMLGRGEPLPTSFACAACPLSQFGTAHQGGVMGRAAACKAMRRLVVLVDGWTQPALLTLPPTSLKSFDTYASALARQRSAYFAVKTKIALEGQKSASGDPYSVATFTVAGKIEEPGQMAAVFDLRRQFETLVRAMPIDAAEYEAPLAGNLAPERPGLVNQMPPSETEELPPFGDEAPLAGDLDPFGEPEQAALIDQPPSKKQRGIN